MLMFSIQDCYHAVGQTTIQWSSNWKPGMFSTIMSTTGPSVLQHCAVLTIQCKPTFFRWTSFLIKLRLDSTLIEIHNYIPSWFSVIMCLLTANGCYMHRTLLSWMHALGPLRCSNTLLLSNNLMTAPKFSREISLGCFSVTLHSGPLASGVFT